MNNQLGIETAIYINEKVSHKNVQGFLNNVNDKAKVEANVIFNTEQAMKAISKITNIKNTKIEIFEDGTIQSIKEVELASGKLLSIRERINEEGEREIKSIRMLAKGQENYAQITSELSKEIAKQGQLQLQLEKAKGGSKEVLNEELKVQNKIVRSLTTKAKKFEEYREGEEAYEKLQKQIIQNENNLKKLKIQNSEDKQAKNYATILKSQDKEYQLRKQMVNATAEEVELLQKKVDIEKKAQMSAQQSIYGSRMTDKNMQEVVKTNREIIEQSLEIEQAKKRQADLDKRSVEAFNRLLSLEKQKAQLQSASHGKDGATANAYQSQIKAVEAQIKQTETLITKEGLENSERRLKIEQQREATINRMAIKEAQSTDKDDAKAKADALAEQSKLYAEMLNTEKEISKLEKQRETTTGKEEALELTNQINTLEQKSAQIQEEINTKNLASAQKMMQIEDERTKRANDLALILSRQADAYDKEQSVKEENDRLQQQKKLYDELYNTEKKIATLTKQKAKLGTNAKSERERVEIEKQIVKLKQNSNVLEFKLKNAGLQSAKDMEKIEESRLALINEIAIIESRNLDKENEINFQKQLNKALEEQKELYSQLHKEQDKINSLTKKAATSDGQEQLEYQEQLIQAEGRLGQIRERIHSENLVSLQEEARAIEKQQRLKEEMAVIEARQEDDRRKTEDTTNNYIEMSRRKLTDRLRRLSEGSSAKFVDQRQVEEVKRQIDELNGLSLDQAKKQVQSLGQTITEMGTQARINQVNKLSSAFEKMKSTLMSLPAQYMGLQAGINAVENAMRNAAEHVRTVDTAWTNMSMTMSTLQRGDFDNLVSQSTELAANMGATSQNVLAIAQTFANDGTTISEVMEKLEGSTALMNVSGMAPEEVTAAVMSIANSFRLFEDGTMDTAEATQYLGDIITTVSANMDMDFTKPIGDSCGNIR